MTETVNTRFWPAPHSYETVKTYVGRHFATTKRSKLLLEKLAGKNMLENLARTNILKNLGRKILEKLGQKNILESFGRKLDP